MKYQSTSSKSHVFSRRQFVTGVTAGSLLYGLGGFSTSYGNAAHSTQKPDGPVEIAGNQFDLSIGYQPVNYTGSDRIATTVNGSLPAPTLRWKEGQSVTLRVANRLSHDSSIHWHGLILPTEMDGVPGLSFDGIKPGETFVYQFDVNQSGTYWYHSHSGFQEQTGVYGAIIIDPKEPDPVQADREHVVVLSDWSDEDPHNIYAKLKKQSHYYNTRERTGADLWRDIKNKGVAQTWNGRQMWNQMRMSDRDIADVTGYTYTFLMNGFTPEQGWRGLFKKGEKVRLRIINAAAMTIFDVRIPGLKMKVVATDGQNIEPVSVDEFRIGVAETYDVVIEPSVEQAYTLFAQNIDRSGFARGIIAPDRHMQAAIPEMDPPPTLGHADMGMDHGMGHGTGHSMDHGTGHSMHQEMDHSMHQEMDHSMHHDQPSQQTSAAANQIDHSHHAKQPHVKKPEAEKPRVEMPKAQFGTAGLGSNSRITHVSTEFGPHVDMRADAPMSGLHDPGLGLRDHMKLYGRRVLTYGDIRNLTPTIDTREPSREIELHLTGNMSRYMWSINGIKFADAEPLHLSYGERVRITLVNDTMMTHPIHLHGMWSELETGDAKYIPRKHVVIVQPGSKISYLVTADAIGRWAYHCHLLYHMPGMFRDVRVS
jgi:CopA family copper-resistance protein